MSVSIDVYGIGNPFTRQINPTLARPDEDEDESFYDELPADHFITDFGDGASAAVITGTKAQWIEFATKLLAAAQALPDIDAIVEDPE